jgi:hypothetical protein
MLPADTFEIGKRILTLYLAKLRYKAEDILETHELFIYENIHGITNSFCKHLLKQSHPSLGFELHYFLNCSCYYHYVFNAHDAQTNTLVKLFCVTTRVLIHSSFCLCNFTLLRADRIMPNLPASHSKSSRLGLNDVQLVKPHGAHQTVLERRELSTTSYW